MAITDWKLQHIDWPATAAKYGYKTQKELTGKSKVIVICQTCKQPNLETTIVSMRIRASQKKKGQTEYTPICKHCQQSKTWENPEFCEKQKTAQSKAMKKVWEDQEYRVNQSEKHSKTTTGLWLNDDYKTKVSKGIKLAHKKIAGYTDKATQALKDSEEKRRTNLDIKRQNPEYKKKLSERTKKLWQDPEYRAKMAKIYADPEYKAKMSKITKKLWENPEYAKKILQNQSSKLEDHLADLLDDFGINYKRQFVIGHWPFDFMIPHVGKDILIEVHGNYWHGTKVDYNRSRDVAKATYVERYCSDMYDMHVIWENEFLTPQRVVDRILTIVGIRKPCGNDFKFSDCVVKTVVATDANKFLSRYHYIASGGRQGLNVGTFLNGELLACARFCNPTRAESATRLGFDQKKVAELTRFAIKEGYHKKNFASWMLSRCMKFLMGKKCCLTFADTTYGHLGTIYKASNWVHDGIIPPDYFYIDNNGYVMHKRTLWGHAKKMGLSERDYCDKYDYVKKWGKEKHRYIFWIQKTPARCRTGVGSLTK